MEPAKRAITVSYLIRKTLFARREDGRVLSQSSVPIILTLILA
jgi:hypothetical protein